MLAPQPLQRRLRGATPLALPLNLYTKLLADIKGRIQAAQLLHQSLGRAAAEDA